MKRSILVACAGVLAAGCASGADVADDEAPADSAVVETLEGIPPRAESQPKATQP